MPVLASVTGIALLVWGVLDGGQHGAWLAAGTLVPLVAGVAVLAALVVIEARAEHPIADVRLFRRAQFTVPVLALSIGSGQWPMGLGPRLWLPGRDHGGAALGCLAGPGWRPFPGRRPRDHPVDMVLRLVHHAGETANFRPVGSELRLGGAEVFRK
jgi:hypothetical protein